VKKNALFRGGEVDSRAGSVRGGISEKNFPRLGNPCHNFTKFFLRGMIALAPE